MKLSLVLSLTLAACSSSSPAAAPPSDPDSGGEFTCDDAGVRGPGTAIAYGSCDDPSVVCCAAFSCQATAAGGKKCLPQ